MHDQQARCLNKPAAPTPPQCAACIVHRRLVPRPGSDQTIVGWWAGSGMSCGFLQAPVQRYSLFVREKGSLSCTSSAAARIRPSLSAEARASSSTRPPRAVLMRKAPTQERQDQQVSSICFYQGVFKLNKHIFYHNKRTTRTKLPP